MSDLTFDDAMESQFVFYNEENTNAAGPKMVHEYRGVHAVSSHSLEVFGVPYEKSTQHTHSEKHTMKHFADEKKINRN